jgi:low temperature requirement protein LtrA
MRGIVVPKAEEDFTADAVELFFDLSFVYAFSRLVAEAFEHPDWAAFGRVLLTFSMMWFAWSQFTWSANAVPGNQRPVRFYFLVATVVSIPMGASINSALAGGGIVFALAIAAIVLLALHLMVNNVPEGAPIPPKMKKYAVIVVIAEIVGVAGAFFDGGLRIGAWIASLALLGAAMASGTDGNFLIRPGHMAERHALIFIVALGEVVVAVGVPVSAAMSEGSGLGGPTLISLVGAGAFATLMWWSYFDRFQPGIELAASQLSPKKLVNFTRDNYTIMHLPIVLGVIFVAVAIEEIVVHPTAPVGRAYQYMLMGGLLATAAAMTIVVYRSYKMVPWERLVMVAAVVVLLIVGTEWDGMFVLLAVDFVIATMLVVEYQRVEAPYKHELDAPVADAEV